LDVTNGRVKMTRQERKKSVRTYTFTYDELKEAMFDYVYCKTCSVEDHHRDNSTIVTRADTIDLIITIEESITAPEDV
jgi:hypothetical protein